MLHAVFGTVEVQLQYSLVDAYRLLLAVPVYVLLVIKWKKNEN